MKKLKSAPIPCFSQIACFLGGCRFEKNNFPKKIAHLKLRLKYNLPSIICSCTSISIFNFLPPQKCYIAWPTEVTFDIKGTRMEDKKFVETVLVTWPRRPFQCTGVTKSRCTEFDTLFSNNVLFLTELF